MTKTIRLISPVDGEVYAERTPLTGLEARATVARARAAQAAWAALDRIRSDVLLAGRGLVRPMRLGIVAPAEEAGGRWVLVRAGAAPVLTAGPRAGETTVAVAGAVGVAFLSCLFGSEL